MKKIVLLLLAMVLLLTSCKEAIENIEVTTLKTGLTINNKIARSSKEVKITTTKEPEETSAEMTKKSSETQTSEESATTESSESTSSENSSEETSESKTLVEENSTLSVSEITLSETSTTTTTTTTEATSKGSGSGKKDFLDTIQNVAIGDIITTSNEPTTERDRYSDEADDVQIDLSMFSATVKYAELYNILFSPEEYEGMIMRLDGIYLYDEDVENNKRYHFVVVLDQAACCQQGMEFKLDPGLSYPKQGTKVEIKGEFRFYEEDGMPWYYLQVYDIR